MAGVLKSQSSVQDLVNVQEVKYQNEMGIQQAKSLLMGRQQTSSDPVESVRITAEIAKLDAELYWIRAEYHAFLAEQSSLQLPTPDDVQRAKDAARKIAGLVVASTTLTDIIDLTTQLINTWNGGK